jgi:hypothetical protein
MSARVPTPPSYLNSIRTLLAREDRLLGGAGNRDIEAAQSAHSSRLIAALSMQPAITNDVWAESLALFSDTPGTATRRPEETWRAGTNRIRS